MEKTRILVYLLKHTTWCKVGNFVTSKVLKRDLQIAYDTLEIKKKAKATDITDYINAEDLVKKIDGKPTRGYIIVNF